MHVYIYIYIFMHISKRVCVFVFTHCCSEVPFRRPANLAVLYARGREDYKSDACSEQCALQGTFSRH